MSPSRDALIVAVDEYSDAGLSRLRAPSHDAEQLADVLGDPAIGDFHVAVLRNETAQRTRLAVEDFFADRSPGDLLLLHFSCHGLKNAAGELFLAASDSQPTRLASTGIAADFVNQQMADSRAQRIALFLDCCYGGAFPRGMVVRAGGDVQLGDTFASAQKAAGGRGRIVVTASSSVEYAFEGDQLAAGASVNPSVFTGSVVAGLSSGDADRDGDGWVGLNELFGYVADRVRQTTPHQTPHLWAFGSEGDLLLARSRRRRVRPEAVPAELAEAAVSALSATRLGVAVELRDRLLGSDVGQALGALQVLRGMVDDDSRRVAAVAADAISAATLTVTPAALDLGSSAAGRPVEGVLQLSGCPLAMVAEARCSPEWLRAEIDGPQVRVTATIGAAGRYDGTVTVITPVGEHLLPVGLDVVAAESASDQPAPDQQANTAGTGHVARTSAPHQKGATSAASSDTSRDTDMGVSGIEPHATPTAAAADEPPQPARRPWWPVTTGLILSGSGLVAATDGVEKLWYLPNGEYVDPHPLTGFPIAAVGVIVAALAALVWPRFAPHVLGVSAGLGMFFVVYAGNFLLTGQYYDPDRSNWALACLLGAVSVGLVAAETLRRRLFRRTPRRTPGFAELGPLVVGGVLLFVAPLLDLYDGYTVLSASDGLAWAWPVVVVLAPMSALLLLDLSDELRTLSAAAVVTYLVADSVALSSLLLLLDIFAGYVVTSICGNVLLLVAVTAVVRRAAKPAAATRTT